MYILRCMACGLWYSGRDMFLTSCLSWFYTVLLGAQYQGPPGLTVLSATCWVLAIQREPSRAELLCFSACPCYHVIPIEVLDLGSTSFPEACVFYLLAYSLLRRSGESLASATGRWTVAISLATGLTTAHPERATSLLCGKLRSARITWTGE